MRNFIFSVVIALAITAGAQTEFKSTQMSDNISIENMPSGTTLTFNRPWGILPNTSFSELIPGGNGFYCRLDFGTSSDYRVLSGVIEISGVSEFGYGEKIVYKIKDKDLKFRCGNLERKTTIGMVRAKLIELGIELVLAEAVPF